MLPKEATTPTKVSINFTGHIHAYLEPVYFVFLNVQVMNTTFEFGALWFSSVTHHQCNCGANSVGKQNLTVHFLKMLVSYLCIDDQNQSVHL